jgi:large subunit ribosomal protein L13Ae
MIPYKTRRGAECFANLKCYEGIPEEFAKLRRVVIPSALRCNTIHTDRPTTKLGRMSTTMGWKYGKVVAKLEEKRKAASAEYYEQKKEHDKAKARAIEAANKKLGEAAVKFLETYVE